MDGEGLAWVRDVGSEEVGGGVLEIRRASVHWAKPGSGTATSYYLCLLYRLCYNCTSGINFVFAAVFVKGRTHSLTCPSFVAVITTLGINATSVNKSLSIGFTYIIWCVSAGRVCGVKDVLVQVERWQFHYERVRGDGVESGWILGRGGTAGDRNYGMRER